MRFFGYPYNDLVICKDSPDYLSMYVISSKSVNAFKSNLDRYWCKIRYGFSQAEASLYPLPCKCKCTFFYDYLAFFAVTIWPAAGQIASPSRKRYLTGRRSNSLKYYQMLFGRLPICKLNSKTRTLFDRLPVIL